MSGFSGVPSKFTSKLKSKIDNKIKSTVAGVNNKVSETPRNTGGILGLFKTKEKENSAISPAAGVCGGNRLKSREDKIRIMSAGFRDIFGDTTKIKCDGTVGSSLAIGITTREDGAAGGVSENVLNNYINVQYHIVFSMVPENTVATIQEQIPRDDRVVPRNLSSELLRAGAVTMASTGGALQFDDVILDPDNPQQQRQVTSEQSIFNQSIDVGDRNYYTITEFILDNRYAPTNKNPLVSNLVGGKITLVEPGGFRFNDDIKSIGKAIGYENVNIGRIVYRLNISFSGYDPKTGRWVQVIDIDTRKNKNIPFLTYYVLITKLEAQVTNTGTVYSIDIAPVGAGALRAEDFTTDAMSVYTSGTNTFGGFLDNIQDNLSKKRKDETKKGTNGDGLIRTYDIIAPDALRDRPFYADAWAVQKGLIAEQGLGSLVSVGKDIDILTAIRMALVDLPYVQESFIAKTSEQDNKDFVRPRTHFTVRFNTIYGEKAIEIGDYKNIKIQIIIEPFVSFKKGSYTANTIGDYTALESQIRRVKQMMDLGAIIRKYDYLNTATNSEVIEFGINLSAFYVESMDSSQDFPGSKGIGVQATAASQQKNINQSEITAQGSQTILSSSLLNGIATNDNQFDTILGGVNISKTGANNGLNPYEILGGGKGIKPDTYSFGSNSSEGATVSARKDKYLREFKDWLANDQQQIDNLVVRGDPLWLLSPYASESINRLESISELIRPNTDAIIFIDIKAPTQRNYMDADAYNALADNVNRNPNVMGGFYGVYAVESTFSGGKFTQKIQGYKMNHLNYIERGISFEDIIGASLVSNASTTEVPQLVSNAFTPPPSVFGPRVIETPNIRDIASVVQSRFTDVLKIRGEK